MGQTHCLWLEGTATLRWRWGRTNFQRNFVWPKKKYGNVQINRRNFCMSREFAGGATLRTRTNARQF